MMEINQFDNGWIVETDDTGVVVEYDDTEEDFSKQHAEAIQKLLYNVMEGLGIINSKHNQYRINIEIEKQK